MAAQTTEHVLQDLKERIAAGYALIFLRTWEEARWEGLLAEAMLELERGLFVWTRTTGWQPSFGTGSETGAWVLDVIERAPTEHVFLLKDFHAELSDPLTVRRLRDLVVAMPARRQTILVLDPLATVPGALEKDSVEIVLPLPDYNDLREELDAVLAERVAPDGAAGVGIEPEQEDQLLKAVLGLTQAEARRAWTLALAAQPEVNDHTIQRLIGEKRRLAASSDFLEFHDLEAGEDDVGGLDELKTWLKRRALAYRPEAREQGIPLPKGALLLGVQGCGKSLTARVAARMLSFPLIRLDLSRLLEAGQGASENNLRGVLRLLESISPVVLWLDELEKGFAGVDGEKYRDATMARILAMFLMWMQEQTRPVFVMATANSIQNLPPELLRRGRFDDLFFIDLPNYRERRQILQIHLSRRGWKPEQFALDALAQRTDGFSGAELEQLVSAAMIDAFGHQAMLSDEILDQTRRTMVPLSQTMEEKIFELRQWAQDRCRRATSDNRAAQMLEEELRTLAPEPLRIDEGAPAWAALVQAGQLKAGLVEYVKSEGDVTFAALISDFDAYAPARGEQGLALRSDPQCVVWSGLSQEFCETLIELVANRRLYLHPCGADRYGAGNGLRLPIAAGVSGTSLTRPHWLPVALRNRPSAAHVPALTRLRRIQLSRAT